MKFIAKPGVERPNMRTTGFSSWPPLRRLARVTAKSAPFNAAAANNSAQFCLSQKRCSELTLKGAVATGVGASTNAVGASGYAEAKGAWACKAGLREETTT